MTSMVVCLRLLNRSKIPTKYACAY